MKIGITCYPTYGGSGVVATELGIELAARGHEIHFITYSAALPPHRPRANIHFHEVAVSNYPLFEHPPYDLALATRMAEVAELYSLDLLHVHYAIPHSVSAYLAQQMLPTRGNQPARSSPRCTAPTSRSSGSTAPTCPSPASASRSPTASPPSPPTSRDRTYEAFNITPRSRSSATSSTATSTSRNPSSSPPCAPASPNRDEKLLVHLSNFRPVKRVTDVVEVFAQVARAMPARLLLIGDGPDRSAAEYLAARHGVQDRIHFLGKQENVNELLPLADLMLMPSEMESFGLAALEAMACPSPPSPLASAASRNSIDHNRNGLLFDPGDVNAMSSAAIDLLGDPDRLDRHGPRRPQNRAGSLLRLPHHPPL